MNAKEVMSVSPIVPVVVIERLEDALEIAQALLNGGINIMEITLRTKPALEAISLITKELPQMHVGAGTVTNSKEFKDAVYYGAKFVFSPGNSKELMQVASELNIPFIPGVATPSEIMLAKSEGFEYCKLFPATLVGGVKALKGYSSVFSTMKFCPTGGVNLENVKEFLALENVMCVGGTWMLPPELIKEKNFSEVTQLCEEALQSVRSE